MGSTRLARHSQAFPARKGSVAVLLDSVLLCLLRPGYWRRIGLIMLGLSTGLMIMAAILNASLFPKRGLNVNDSANSAN